MRRGGNTTRESTDGRSLVTEHKREFVQMAQSRCAGKPDHILMILGCVVRRCEAEWARLGRGFGWSSSSAQQRKT